MSDKWLFGNLNSIAIFASATYDNNMRRRQALQNIELTEKEKILRARKKMMDYVARRDHSEKELRQKMREQYSQAEIDLAIEYGKEKGWIPDSPESQQSLAEKFTQMLHRRGKGIHAINHYLQSKGLPQQKPTYELELEKAQELLENKFASWPKLDAKEKAKAGRFLMSKGFESQVVREILFRK